MVIDNNDEEVLIGSAALRQMSVGSWREEGEGRGEG